MTGISTEPETTLPSPSGTKRGISLTTLKASLSNEENIIGREQEISKLENYISSRKSEFIAIYGRWRVGKTYEGMGGACFLKKLYRIFFASSNLYDYSYLSNSKNAL